MPRGVCVIIASRNGETTLPHVFAALRECAMPECPVRFLLVDNGSDDATRSFMEDFADGRQAEVVLEPRHGKSFALNAALDRAEAELIAFLDDDAVPDRDWLVSYWRAMHEHPETGVFIGQVRPRFLAPAPPWLVHLCELGRSCASTPAGMTGGECSPARAKGLNWAIRASALGSERFDEVNNNLLRQGKPVGGQDTEMARRLHRKGHGVRFVPSALAHHIVRPHEMSARAVFERYRRIGRGSAAQGDRSLPGKLVLPAEVAAFSLLAAGAWIVGARKSAALNLTRLASRLGRLEYLLSR